MKHIALLVLCVELADFDSGPLVATIQPPDPEQDLFGPSPVVSAPPPSDRASMTEHRLLLTVNFATGSHQILPDSDSTLNNLANALKDDRMRGYFVEINGHTDVSGQVGYNMALSYLRARAVMSYLAARGVPPPIMRAQGFGSLQLLNSANPTDPANRRVEIVSASR